MGYLITNVCPLVQDQDFEAFLNLQNEMIGMNRDEALRQYRDRTGVLCSLLLLAKFEDQPVGSLLAVDNYLEKPPIVRLDGVVHPQHRRKGIMSAMTQIVEWWAGDGGWDYCELSSVLNPIAEYLCYTLESGVYRKGVVKKPWAKVKIPFETRLTWEVKETLVDKISQIVPKEGWRFGPDYYIFKMECGREFTISEHCDIGSYKSGDLVEVGLNTDKNPAWLYDPHEPIHWKKRETF